MTGEDTAVDCGLRLTHRTEHFAWPGSGNAEEEDEQEEEKEDDEDEKEEKEVRLIKRTSRRLEIQNRTLTSTELYCYVKSQTLIHL